MYDPTITAAEQGARNATMLRPDVQAFMLVAALDADPATPAQVETFRRTAPPEVRILIRELTRSTCDAARDEDAGPHADVIVNGLVGWFHQQLRAQRTPVSRRVTNLAQGNDDAMLRRTYEAAFDVLRQHPEFDGRPRPGLHGLMRKGVDPSDVQPWPGVADARHMTRDEWVEARLDAVRRGDEEPALRPRGHGR